MNPPVSTPAEPTANEPRPEDLAEIGVYQTAAEGFERGLVALAAGWAFWLLPAEQAEEPQRRYRLLVEPAAVEDMRVQLAKFERERVGWPPRPIDDGAPRRRTELFTPLLWALAVLAAFYAEGVWPRLTAAGTLDARAIFDRHEWWRPATALFLHADAAHLLSNAVSGIFVFGAVLTTIGRRRGWLLLGSAAVLGNLAAAAINHAGEYRSLGASTAVFAALGLLTGRAVRVLAGARHAGRWRAMAVPLAAGLTVLGLFGAGGVEIDVLAHVTGFAAGSALGVMATGPARPAVPVQPAG